MKVILQKFLFFRQFSFKFRSISCKCLSIILITLLLAGVFCQYACERPNSRASVCATDFYLDTIVTITIYDQDQDALLEECMNMIAYYEKIFSRTDPESELYRLNHGMLESDQDGYYTLSDDLYEIIRIGLSYCTLSNDAFNIAIYPLTSLWDFSSNDPEIPNHDDISAALLCISSKDIRLKESNKITFLKEGMGIDLGGIAKGYIADRIKEYLLLQGADRAIINLGGNVTCIGNKDDDPFHVGIQKPFGSHGETATVIQIYDQSVVTSGIYERYFQKDGCIYHHILDPSTGYPCESNLVSVTIVADTSVKADALSTACFVLGMEKGLELIQKTDHAEVLFIDDNDRFHYSDGFLKFSLPANNAPET